MMTGLRLPFPFLSVLLLFCVFASSFLMINALPVGVSVCHHHQIQTLTKFRNEFDYNGCKLSDYLNAVRCDNLTGAVTKLQLPSGCLSGTLKSNSSLFQLQHLRYLNLSDNNFTFSSLPSGFGNLKRLEVLSLSSNGFIGQVPSSFSNLSMLSILDLSHNEFTGSFSFAKSLTKLSILDLSNNYFSFGTLNPNNSLFESHQLRILDLAYNNLGSSPIPSEFGNLKRLEVLSLSSNGFFGQLPSSFSNLSQLTHLDLSKNKFTGSFPQVHNLTKLSIIDLSYNNFTGTIPSSMFTLPFLSNLILTENHLTGPIEILNSSTSSRLKLLDVGHNQFEGKILKPISKLTTLTNLDLSFLNISYPIDIRILSSLKSLVELVISGNSISPTSLSSNSGVPLNMEILVLSKCNITEFPNILKPLQNLQFLDLSRNRIEGKFPEWLWSLPRLSLVAVAMNFLNGFQGPTEVLVNSSVKYLDLQSNLFEGELPLLPLSIKILSARDNGFIGNIPPSICNYKSLMHLMLPQNNITGTIPHCLSNLMVMNLRNNNLEGSIPDMFYAGASLRSLDVGYNRLTGKLPRSLLNCSSLKFLSVDHNRIEDTFPFWLKVLPTLKVLTFRSNKFYGSISPPGQGPLAFPELQILEISNNNFTGSLPPSYFVNWKTSSPKMDEDGRIYMGYKKEDEVVEFFYIDSLDLQYKGLSMEQEMLLSSYNTIDFSGNRLEGHIPESIGLLKELIALNLSNNAFTGHIPLSFSNFTELESLDLSRNQLSGTIPKALGSLSFLAYINVSHNQLKGEIPQGPQIVGQSKSSFEGNAGLCGLPLEDSCFGSYVPSTQQPKEEDKEEDDEVLSWKAVAMGFGPGVLLGLAIAQAIASYKPEWLNKIIGLNKRRNR